MGKLNRIQLVGRVAGDIFYTTTAAAAADLVRFKVAVSDEELHQCLAWGPIGLQLHTHLNTGSQLAIQGRLTYHVFTDRFGQQVHAPEIRVEQFTFLGD